MKISENSFNDVQEMIHRVESWVKEGKVSESKLAGIQKRIDTLDDEYRYDADVEDDYYQLYELQAIVYRLRGQSKKAQDFANRALMALPKGRKSSSKLIGTIAGNVKSPETKIHWDEGDGDVIEKTEREGSVLFFHRSPTTVFWLSLLSLNLYNIYWVYRHWRNINKSSGQKYHAFWRAIFQVFFIHSLIKTIVGAAKEHRNSPWRGSVGWTSAAYIVAVFIGNATSKVTTKSQDEELIYWIFAIILTVLVAAISRAVQQTANYHNEEVVGKDYNFRNTYLGKLYAGEVVLSVIGVILFALGALGSFISFTENAYPQGTETEISAAKDRMDNLTEQYATCSSALSQRHDSVDTTDEAAINSYNNDWQTCEDVRLSQNDAVNEYNRLAGLK